MPRTDPGKRILVVTPQPFYEDRGTPIALRYVIQALCERGFEVDLLAFPFGSDVETPGLRILRTGNPLRISGIPIGFSWRKASLDLLLRAELVRLLRRTRYACVHAVEEAAFLALGPCRRTRVPLIYDMASSIPAQLEDRFPFRVPPGPWILRALERRMVRRADLVLCSAGLEPLVRRLAPGRRVEAWAYPSPRPVSRPGEALRLRRELALPPRAAVLLYTGSFAPYQGVETLVDAMPAILEQQPDAVLVLVGATQAEADALRRRVPREAKGGVRVVLRRPRAELDAWFGLATRLVSARQHGANAPLKLFDYLGTGVRILASRGPAHERFSTHPSVALFDHTPGGFAAAVLAELARPAAPLETAPSGGAASADWSAFADRIARVYTEAIGA